MFAVKIMPKEVIDALVEGGKASAGPPLGPALGPKGVNIKAVIDAINEKTKSFEGMKVPVKVIIDSDTKEFEIEVGVPPVSQLLKKELGLEKFVKPEGTKTVADTTMDVIVKVAKMKHDNTLANDLKGTVKMVLGTCVSAGITVNGKSPKEIIKEVDEGKYDDLIKEE